MALARSLLEKLPLARALQWDALASSPILQTLIINYYTHTHTSPPPIPRLRRFESLWTASLTSWSDQRRNSGCGTGWLLAGAGLLPLWHCRVYGVCAFVLRCFSCSHTVLPKEHSLGVIFFLLTFLMLCCIFFFPCLLAFHYWLYPAWLCIWWIIKNLEPPSMGGADLFPRQLHW